MKNGKLLTHKEKVLITKEGLNANDWLRVKKNAECIEFAHRTNEKTFILRV